MDVRLIGEADGRPLRQAVLRPNMPAAASTYTYARDGIHVGVWADGRLVSVVSFLLEDEGAGDVYRAELGHWRLRGMATLPEMRGRGYGGAALEGGVAEVVRRGGVLAWCNGRTAASAFYRRHGFDRIGAEFETPGTGPHYRFVRLLAATSSCRLGWGA